MSDAAISYAVVIGASSGGPQIVGDILSKLPSDVNAVVVVIQHLPKTFTKSMANRLGKLLPIPVEEVSEGTQLQNSHIYVVPGDSHFFISNDLRVHLVTSTTPVSPSINMGLTSIAEHFGPRTIGVILTGMGSDGVIGAKAIRQLGGQVLVQNEETSTVYGMPKSVQIAGYADEILSPEQIAQRITELTK